MIYEHSYVSEPFHLEANSSGVTWSALFAGAFVTIAMTILMLVIGSALGLASVSPWMNTGVTASTFGKAAAIWIIITQIVSSSVGGYMAGRLRTRWTIIHAHEVYFRDTAHGFLVWAVSLVLMVLFFAGASTGSMMSGAAGAGGASSGGQTANSGMSNVNGMGGDSYIIDNLFRSNRSLAALNDAGAKAEAAGIFTRALALKDIPADDRSYLIRLVSERTGLSAADADRRITDSFVQAKEATDTARKVAAYSFLLVTIGLLVGAFCSCVAATMGGNRRDKVVIVDRAPATPLRTNEPPNTRP